MMMPPSRFFIASTCSLNTRYFSFACPDKPSADDSKLAGIGFGSSATVPTGKCSDISVFHYDQGNYNAKTNMSADTATPPTTNNASIASFFLSSFFISTRLFFSYD